MRIFHHTYSSVLQVFARLLLTRLTPLLTMAPRGSLLFLIVATACIAYSVATPTCPNIITREEWGARAPESTKDIAIPVPYVIIHHSVTAECLTEAECADRMSSMQRYHMETKHWPDIGYSFAIGGDGNVYEGTGWVREGTHTKGYNDRAIGIGFIGNFQEKEASQLMLNTAQHLISCGKIYGYLSENLRVLGARQVRPTTSPGYKLFRQIQEWPEWVPQP